MDLTAFGPYALNVRTNISSYGPRARLIRAYLFCRCLLEQLIKLVLKFEGTDFMTDSSNTYMLMQSFLNQLASVVTMFVSCLKH